MSARFVVALEGLVFLALGIAGLSSPRWVMDLVGYSTSSVPPLVLGEVRGIYGGLFAAMGLFTLFAARHPGANRGALMLLALLWFGVCGGRIAGAYIDGDPGLPGWIAAGCEFVFGLVLAVVSLVTRQKAEKRQAEPTFPLAAGPTEL